MKRILIYVGILYILTTLLTGCSDIKKYDEVVYYCPDGRLVAGTEVPGSGWDLTNNVREFNMWSKEWDNGYNSVNLYHNGSEACFEILRYYNYTEVKK